MMRFCTYGEKEVELLCATYSDVVDYAKCALEWDTLQEAIKSSYQACKFHEFIIKLVTKESHYPAMSSLAEIVAVFPASTAEVERGFSYQNTIKSKSRNRSTS